MPMRAPTYRAESKASVATSRRVAAAPDAVPWMEHIASSSSIPSQDSLL